jgi:HK97 family phage major capsid protein
MAETETDSFGGDTLEETLATRAASLVARRGAQDRSRARKLDEPYGPDDEARFFRDLVVCVDHAARRDAARDDPVTRGRVPTEGFGHSPSVTRPRVDDALARLRRSTEHYDLTTANVAAGIPIATPLAQWFTEAARARSVVANLLPQEPVPPGLKVQVPRFSTGGTVASQSAENVQVSETDPTAALPEAPIEIVAGQLDASRQLVDRAQPTLDVALARDLGAALGTRVDQALLNGSGTAGQTTGLSTIAGVTQTDTDASPTAAKGWKAVEKLVAATATADGRMPTHLLAHPRRVAWLSGDPAVAAAIAASTFQVVPVPCISSVLGAGTNEDEVYAIVADELGIVIDAPRVTAHGDPLSGTLTVRFIAEQTVGNASGRRPTAVGKSNGTLWVTPAWA